MTLIELTRIRWAVRGALVLGVAASVTANVLHAVDNPISQCIAAWPPLALLLTVELISRVPVHSQLLAAGRLIATATIAGIAAWVSYWHMVGVAARYGEAGASPYLIPASVDGLIIVASICLVELGGRIRDHGDAGTVHPDVRSIVPPVPAFPYDYAAPIGPMPAPAEVDRLSTPAVRPRKPQPSSKERIERAHRRTPHATNGQLAERLNLSLKTVRRHRPERELVDATSPHPLSDAAPGRDATAPLTTP